MVPFVQDKKAWRNLVPSVQFKKTWCDLVPFVQFNKTWRDLVPFVQFKKTWRDLVPVLQFKKTWDDLVPFVKFKKTWHNVVPFVQFKKNLTRFGTICTVLKNLKTLHAEIRVFSMSKESITLISELKSNENKKIPFSKAFYLIVLSNLGMFINGHVQAILVFTLKMFLLLLNENLSNWILKNNAITLQWKKWHIFWVSKNRNPLKMVIFGATFDFPKYVF